MLYVTEHARQRLTTLLQAKKSNVRKGKGIRIVRSQTTPDRYSFVPDIKRKGDQVIRDRQGNEILLLARGIRGKCNNMVLDFGQIAEGREKFILKPRGA